MPRRHFPERKIPWRSVPPEVRERAAEALGAPIRRAVRAWGGYAPSATFRLLLLDGRRAFFKGVNAGSNDHMRSALDDEERAYRELRAVIGPWSPAFLGAFRQADWHVLLLQDLGPPTAPPWREEDVRAATQGLAELHGASLGLDLPSWLPRDTHTSFSREWDRFDEFGAAARLIELAGPCGKDVQTWLRQPLPELRLAAEGLAVAPLPATLLHADVRSDNLRVVNGRLRLFDWNWACVGPPEFDLAAFAQSVTGEGGGEPERVVDLYSERLPVRGDVLTSSVSAFAAYLLARGWLPDVAGLPRLRQFQRQQAVVTLTWASRLLSLPRPEWLERLG